MVRTRRGEVLLAVAAGGALGSLARYGLGRALAHPPGGFATATVLANVLGCLLIGVLMAVLDHRPAPHRLVRPFVGVGVLGGFTTFSTYVLDTLDSARAGQILLALLYAVGSVVAGLTAVVAGFLGTRLLLRRDGGAAERTPATDDDLS